MNHEELRLIYRADPFNVQVKFSERVQLAQYHIESQSPYRIKTEDFRLAMPLYLQEYFDHCPPPVWAWWVTFKKGANVVDGYEDKVVLYHKNTTIGRGGYECMQASFTIADFINFDEVKLESRNKIKNQFPRGEPKIE